MSTMKRNLVLLSLLLVFGVLSASAQSTYTVTTTPTFVINTGRAEVLGNVRITASNVGPTIASTIQYVFQNMSCDNNAASGITLNVDGVQFTLVNTLIASVTNTSAGCVVSVTAPGGVATVAGTSFIEIGGVRGRVDFLGGIANVGQNINASLSATPSNSSLFTVPNVGVVGITAVGLNFVSATLGTVLQCIGVGTQPTLTFQEGYNGPFVQHVVSLAATAVPVNPRPVFGGTSNTQVNIVVTGLPTGVTLTWPVFVNSQLSLGVFAAATPLGGSRLERRTLATATTQLYEYVCGDQAQCDINQEVFAFTAVNPNGGSGGLGTAAITLAATPTAAFGTATVAIQLNPPLIVGDATLITNAPLPAAVKPRFNDPLIPAPPAPIASNAPCRTNLLFPFVANVAGFDTGLAIANTSKDPFTAVPATVAQSGTCTLNGFPRATPVNSGATPPAAVAFTTPNIVSGDTFTSSLSASTNPVFNGFTGYIIAICNFQYGHGFAFITDNFGVGAPGLAMGYVALVIPDPNVIAGARLSRAAIGLTQEGEGLSQ